MKVVRGASWRPVHEPDWPRDVASSGSVAVGAASGAGDPVGDAGAGVGEAFVPPGGGRWISRKAGWYPMIIRTDEHLAAIDPDYELHRVQEKWAVLEY